MTIYIERINPKSKFPIKSKILSSNKIPIFEILSFGTLLEIGNLDLEIKKPA
ncbi:MAG: hypothetical protein ACD_5C00137G0006 [uncultured bacterium]|nr:MAG: hypothetical protein ACD_5C00137G0006 [uncultured bacterium]